jgi:hypothetical protein
MISVGLIVLQKNKVEAVQTQNMAYLTVLVAAYINLEGETPFTEIIDECMDIEMA